MPKFVDEADLPELSHITAGVNRRGVGVGLGVMLSVGLGVGLGIMATATPVIPEY